MPISVLARPLDNPGLHTMLENIRTMTGNQVIYRHGAIRKILRELALNRGVAMLIDQHLQGVGDDTSGFAHDGDLIVGLEDDGHATPLRR